ncbi:heme-dependent oxidative N-demethylase subunit alpha family protein [Aliiroseovarius salicola]|uniref:heme-dependent oxidative N-demethylase subunit alpha family protein n=1 Tax=Aliiroseovarius salicola TaxID=3009082 RepID=UPI002FDE06FC
MTRVHVPVEEYADETARRVQRLFDGIQVGRPIWRANALVYNDPELHQPRREEERRPPVTGGQKWLRVERQGNRRLEQSRAVLFSIHTFVLAKAKIRKLGYRTA